MRATLRSILQTLRRWLLPKRSDRGTGTKKPVREQEEERKTKDILPDSATIVSDILRQIEEAGRNDGKKTRKSPGREEWTIYQADFIYAYHFLLSLPHASHERMKNRVRAGIITFTLPLADGCTVELTDNSRRIEADGVIRVRDGGREIIRVLFVEGQAGTIQSSIKKE